MLPRAGQTGNEQEGKSQKVKVRTPDKPMLVRAALLSYFCLLTFALALMVCLHRNLCKIIRSSHSKGRPVFFREENYEQSESLRQNHLAGWSCVSPFDRHHCLDGVIITIPRCRRDRTG